MVIGIILKTLAVHPRIKLFTVLLVLIVEPSFLFYILYVLDIYYITYTVLFSSVFLFCMAPWKPVDYLKIYVLLWLQVWSWWHLKSEKYKGQKPLKQSGSEAGFSFVCQTPFQRTSYFGLGEDHQTWTIFSLAQDIQHSSKCTSARTFLQHEHFRIWIDFFLPKC